MERPVGAHDSVARNDDRDRVGGAGGAHSSSGAGRADGRGDLGIGAGLARGDTAQRLPDAPPEGSSVDVERQRLRLGSPAAHGQVRHDRGHVRQSDVVADSAAPGNSARSSDARRPRRRHPAGRRTDRALWPRPAPLPPEWGPRSSESTRRRRRLDTVPEPSRAHRSRPRTRRSTSRSRRRRAPRSRPDRAARRERSISARRAESHALGVTPSDSRNSSRSLRSGRPSRPARSRSVGTSSPPVEGCRHSSDRRLNGIGRGLRFRAEEPVGVAAQASSSAGCERLVDPGHDSDPAASRSARRTARRADDAGARDDEEEGRGRSSPVGNRRPFGVGGRSADFAETLRPHPCTPSIVAARRVASGLRLWRESRTSPRRFDDVEAQFRGRIGVLTPTGSTRISACPETPCSGVTDAGQSHRTTEQTLRSRP